MASALKRLISKEDSTRSANTPNEDGQRYRLPGSISSSSIAGNLATTTKLAGSIRITDQVIEEVDEQLTITSQRGADVKRPQVQDLFQNNEMAFSTNRPELARKSSDATDYSPNTKLYMRTQSNVEPSLFPPGGVDALLSTSAPTDDSSPLARALHSPMRYDRLGSPVGSRVKLDSTSEGKGELELLNS